MELSYTLIAKALLIAVMAGVLLCLLRELLRQRRALRAEDDAHALRLSALEEQLRLHSQKASNIEAKMLNAWSGTRKFRVEDVVAEADQIRSFYLSPHDGKRLPSFEPGQYLTFILDVPGQSRPVVRCYSLSDTPLERQRYRVTIKHITAPAQQADAPPGVSSSYFHETVKQGDILDCKAPRGNFYLNMDAHTPVVLVGGGVGITPMLSMIRSLALSGSTRETWLFYGVRTMQELVHAQELKQFDLEHENIHVRFCLSEPGNEDTLGRDYDYGERVSIDLLSTALPSMNYDYYICGPAPMMSSLTDGLSAAGVSKTKIHYESFGPASVKPEPRPESQSSEYSDVSFSIKFAKSAKELMWKHSDGTILDFAEAHDIALDSGCRAGSCGTCAVALRAGSVEYVDDIDVEPEAGSCLACMAIPKEAIVIDA